MQSHYDPKELVRFVLKLKSIQVTHDVEVACLRMKIQHQKEEREKIDHELGDLRRTNTDLHKTNAALDRELDITKKRLSTCETDNRDLQTQLAQLKETNRNNDIYFTRKKQKLRESHRKLRESLNEGDFIDIEKDILPILEEFSKN